jgi:hypothetical protein
VLGGNDDELVPPRDAVHGRGERGVHAEKV